MKFDVSMADTYNKSRKVSIFFAGLLIWIYFSYVFVTQTILLFYNLYPAASIWMSFVFPNMINTMIIFEFSSYVYTLTLRMKLIKKLIEDVQCISQVSLRVSERSFEKEHKESFGVKDVPIIEVIGKAHEKLCVAVESINSYFSIRMLFLSLDAFILITFFEYYTLASILDHDPDLLKYVGINMFFLAPLITNFCQMTCIVIFCRFFYNEVNMFL